VRIVHLTPELPYAPGGSGGSTRQFHLLRRLRDHGHAVTVVAPVHREQVAGAAGLREAGIGLAAVPRPSSRVRETLAAVAHRPELLPALAREPLLAWQVDVFWTRLRIAAAAALSRERPDVISVEHDWAAAWHGSLPPGVPRALTLQNLSGSYYDARARATTGVRRRALALEARRFERFDRAHLDAYDLLVTMSELDRERAQRLSSARCEAVPNGVDTTALVPAPTLPAGEDPVLLYAGTMSYPPNAEGLRWLLREVWPRVLAGAPTARLLVVGRDPEPELVSAASERVEFTGWVEAMAPSFARASIVLVPILSGGGTRLKVLDGLASGRPVLSTSAGAEGIDLVDGEHGVLADGPEAFAHAAVTLLGDPERRRALGVAGRELAERAYDWRALGDRLEELLRELAER
jgi:glycosyltransferase involved in cell wall biosynthesis